MRMSHRRQEDESIRLARSIKEKQRDHCRASGYDDHLGGLEAVPGSAFLAFSGEDGERGLGMDLPACLGLCTRRRTVLAWLHVDHRAKWIEDRHCWAGQCRQIWRQYD